MPARRRPGPGWVPNQHGAWAMLLAPLVVGAVRSGPQWVHLLLTLTWLVGYLAFYAAGLWLRARRRPRYRRPLLVYLAATAVLGVALLAVAGEVVGWGLVYAPLLVVSLVHSAGRRDRTLTNDAVTVIAACLMTVVAYGLGSEGTATPAEAPWSWLPGSAAGEAWALAGVLLAYFLGTVLYVKTMIRERGNRAMYVGSVAHHLLALLVVGLAPLPWTVPAVFALLAVRAAVVPRAWPGTSPLRLGVGEIVATVALSAALLAW